MGGAARGSRDDRLNRSKTTEHNTPAHVLMFDGCPEHLVDVLQRSASPTVTGYCRPLRRPSHALSPPSAAALMCVSGRQGARNARLLFDVLFLFAVVRLFCVLFSALRVVLKVGMAAAAAPGEGQCPRRAGSKC